MPNIIFGPGFPTHWGTWDLVAYKDKSPIYAALIKFFRQCRRKESSRSRNEQRCTRCRINHHNVRLWSVDGAPMQKLCVACVKEMLS